MPTVSSFRSFKDLKYLGSMNLIVKVLWNNSSMSTPCTERIPWWFGRHDDVGAMERESSSCRRLGLRSKREATIVCCNYRRWSRRPTTVPRAVWHTCCAGDSGCYCCCHRSQPFRTTSKIDFSRTHCRNVFAQTGLCRSIYVYTCRFESNSVKKLNRIRFYTRQIDLFRFTNLYGLKTFLF